MPQAGHEAPGADPWTNRCTASSQSCTCSRTSPAPVGNSSCGPTVHPLGGPASRQAGLVYRKQPGSRKRDVKTRCSRPNRIARISTARKVGQSPILLTVDKPEALPQFSLLADATWPYGQNTG